MNASNRPRETRLNAFQKVMLQWSSLHPYNAVHVYKLAGPLRRDRLLAAITSAFDQLGVGIVHLSEDGRTYRHEIDRDPPLEIIGEGDDAESALHAYTARALNLQFERPSGRPFRFAAVDGGSGFHYVVLTYDHWVADSIAARILLRTVLNEYFDLAFARNLRPIDLAPATYRDTFRRWVRGRGFLQSSLRAIRDWNRNRTAWRVACWSNTEWTVGYRVYQTTPGTVARLREFAGRNGGTVNDVLLAAFGRALAQVLPTRGRDHGLALGNIADIRGLADVDLSHTFGAFLSYYLVRTPSELPAGLDAATQQIAALTRPIKAQSRCLDSLVNMHAVNAVWPWLTASAKRHFMRKSLPMSGGISNVVIRDPWMNANRHVILDYHRGASTGPSLPIVLSPTTFGDRMNIGVSYRLTGFSEAKIDRVMELLRGQLEHPNKASRGEQPQRTSATCLADIAPTTSSERSETARVAVSG